MALSFLTKLEYQLTEKDLFWGAGSGVAIYFLGMAFNGTRNAVLAASALSAIAIPAIRCYQKMKEGAYHLHERQMYPLQQEFPEGFYDLQPVLFHLTPAQKEARELLLHYKETLPEGIASKINSYDSVSFIEQVRKVQKWIKEHPQEIIPSREEAPTPKIDYFEEEQEHIEQNRQEIDLSRKKKAAWEFLTCCKEILPKKIASQIDPHQSAALFEQERMVMDWIELHRNHRIFASPTMDLSNLPLSDVSSNLVLKFFSNFPRLKNISLPSGCAAPKEQILGGNTTLSFQDFREPEEDEDGSLL